MSTTEIATPPRLREIPWEALSGEVSWVLAAIVEVLSGQPAERVVDRALRQHKKLSSDARRAVVEAIFGVGLWRRRIAFHASGTDAGELLWTFLHLFGGLDAERVTKLTGLARPSLLTLSVPPSLGDRHSLPEWLASSLLANLGADEAEQFAATLATPAPVFVRANTLSTNRDALADLLEREGVAARPCRYSPIGLELTTPRVNVLGLKAHQAGLFEVQDEGSQLLGLLVGAHPGQTVLDYCAGAGGKSLLLAGEVGLTGRVLCHDIDHLRLERLRVRADRAGATNIAVLHATPAADLRVDAVLVDAPCSELGALRRGPDLRWRIDPSTFAAVEQSQREILDGAAIHVRPGGTLVYATCTLRREENVDVALAFERAHPEFERVAPVNIRSELIQDGFFVALPHRHGTDGFFAAVFRRRG